MFLYSLNKIIQTKERVFKREVGERVEWQGTAELSDYRFMSSVIPSSILWPAHDKRNILKFLETRIGHKAIFCCLFFFFFSG